MLDTIRKLWAHVVWADRVILGALQSGRATGEAVKEYAHVLGADEIWLARLTGRASRTPVWPDSAVSELPALASMVHDGYREYLASLDQRELDRVTAYTNTAGVPFRTPVRDILLHVVLHAHYHRGKINLLLRQAGLDPAPADYIAFARGAPAAVTPKA
jgi:uncharacterized damage-inducible protein DinB